MLRRCFIPIIFSIVKGGSRQEILGEGRGFVGLAHLLKMEPAIKLNAKPFTAWGLGPPKGPGKVCILDALSGAFLGKQEAKRME